MTKIVIIRKGLHDLDCSWVEGQALQAYVCTESSRHIGAQCFGSRLNLQGCRRGRMMPADMADTCTIASGRNGRT